MTRPTQERRIALLAFPGIRAFDVTVSALAARAGMSPGSFARHFTAATGTTPLRWLLGHRIAAAQKLLERTDLPIPEVARRSGFGSEVTMRQHFTSRLAISPRAYRASFAAPDRPCR